MLGLLYFGRLEKEKWIDAIIEMIEIFEEKNQKIPFQLFIFWSGSREKKIEKLANKQANIHYFGRKDLETIQRYKENCQYCLMPSECLETFGLSALTAIQRWLTPIWYAKWGLKEFINPTHDLTHQLWDTTGQKLYNLIRQLQASSFKLQTVNIANFNKDNRIVNFHALAGKNVEKILIVSDFINKIWWIETYINDVKTLLEPHGYKIELCWGAVPSWTIGKLAKHLGIITGLGNFREAIQLRRKIKKIKPDLIRYNSVMRYLGRASIRASKNSTAKKRMMFHDLGYFYPFPSELTNEHQIKTPLTWTKFVSSYKTNNIIKKIATIWKFTTIRLIKQQIKKRMDTFLVPSTFMVDIVHKSYKIAEKKIKVFPHFIQD